MQRVGVRAAADLGTSLHWRVLLGRQSAAMASDLLPRESAAQNYGANVLNLFLSPSGNGRQPKKGCTILAWIICHVPPESGDGGRSFLEK